MNLIKLKQIRSWRNQEYEVINSGNATYHPKWKLPYKYHTVNIAASEATLALPAGSSMPPPNYSYLLWKRLHQCLGFRWSWSMSHIFGPKEFRQGESTKPWFGFGTAVLGGYLGECLIFVWKFSEGTACWCCFLVQVQLVDVVKIFRHSLRFGLSSIVHFLDGKFSSCPCSYHTENWMVMEIGVQLTFRIVCHLHWHIYCL